VRCSETWSNCLKNGLMGFVGDCQGESNLGRQMGNVGKGFHLCAVHGVPEATQPELHSARER